MPEERTRIIDIAEELGLSTATVSNVIHGKTKKVSSETVRRVQELLEQRQYIPSMAGILLAQNDSRIIGVVVNDHEKYEGRALEDMFISSSLNCLASEIEKAGFFMMVKVTGECQEIIRFASMWNMEGLVVIGFCEQDYKRLRDEMHIPFVVYDGYFKEPGRLCNLMIDNYSGGFQMGAYFCELGHKRVLSIADNCVCMDRERVQGFRAAMAEGKADFMTIPSGREARWEYYQQKLLELKSYTAIFAVSDYYAIDLMGFLQENRVRIPEDISVAGFDDCPLCNMVSPPLTTIRQDGRERARTALSMLRDLKEGKAAESELTLPVSLIKRKSVKQAGEMLRSK